MPSREIVLETLDGEYYHFKTDIFKGEITYSTSKEIPANLVTISASRAFEVISMNKRGYKPQSLDNREPVKEEKKEFKDVVGQDSLTRFDKGARKKNGNNGKNNKFRRNGNRHHGGDKRKNDDKE